MSRHLSSLDSLGSLSGYDSTLSPSSYFCPCKEVDSTFYFLLNVSFMFSIQADVMIQLMKCNHTHCLEIVVEIELCSFGNQ